MQIGQTAPDFTVMDLNGRPITLKAMRGRSAAVLLVFLRHLG